MNRCVMTAVALALTAWAGAGCRTWTGKDTPAAPSARRDGIRSAGTQAAAQAQQPDPIQLLAVRHDIGRPTLNQGLTGQPLRIGTAEFEDGICVQAPARLDLALSSQCIRFSASIGVDLAPRMKGEVSFVILLDGREAYRSELLSKGMEPVAIDLDLAGARRMALIVEEAGIVVGDMADWAEPRITLDNGADAALTHVLANQGFRAFETGSDLPRRHGHRVCNVREFGARGDGTADDTPAFEQAFAALAAAAHGVLHIPAGDYRITRTLELVLPQADSARAGLTLRGEGQSVSNILCDSPEGAFRLTDPLAATQFNLRDFSIVAVRENSGTALDLAVPGRGARGYRTLTVENVDIRGDDVRESHFFTTGIDATGHWRPLFRNVIVRSNRGRGQSDSEDRNMGGTCGIRADWCYAPAFDHCYVWGVNTGYSIICRHAREGPEDASFIRCTAVGCAVGIDIDTPIPEPQLVITACHVNCSEVGIRLRNRKFFSITDNLMYSAVPSETAYTDILITGRSHCGVISGNIFHFSGRDVYRSDPPSQRVNVHVTDHVRDVAITGNVFNAKGTMTRVEDGARRIVTDGNQVANAHAR